MIAHYLCPNGHETVVSPVGCKEPLTVECGECSGGVIVTAKLIGAESSQDANDTIAEIQTQHTEREWNAVLEVAAGVAESHGKSPYQPSNIGQIIADEIRALKEHPNSRGGGK